MRKRDIGRMEKYENVLDKLCGMSYKIKLYLAT